MNKTNEWKTNEWNQYSNTNQTQLSKLSSIGFKKLPLLTFFLHNSVHNKRNHLNVAKNKLQLGSCGYQISIIQTGGREGYFPN